MWGLLTNPVIILESKAGHFFYCSTGSGEELFWGSYGLFSRLFRGRLRHDFFGRPKTSNWLDDDVKELSLEDADLLQVCCCSHPVKRRAVAADPKARTVLDAAYATSLCAGRATKPQGEVISRGRHPSMKGFDAITHAPYFATLMAQHQG